MSKKAGHLRRKGVTLIEAIISMGILAVGVIGGIQMHGSFVIGARMQQEIIPAQQLASDLMAEILSQQFADPAYGPDSFGLGGDETGPDRSLYDDVDDYDGWSATPPQLKDGTELTQFDDCERSVIVQSVNPEQLDEAWSDGSSVAKRVIVTVTLNNKERAVLYGYSYLHSAYDE